MSDEIGNNNNIQNGDKKDDNPIKEEVKAKDYDIKPKKSLASIFFRKYNPTEGLYITQYSWDKDGGNLITDSKLQFTYKEKRIIKCLLLNPLPPHLRRQYWLIASGAKREMKNNPGYYASLTTNFPDYIPCPYENQIDLDIHRTFPEDPFFEDQEILKKLRNICIAYSRRSISIGYCQGFNHIIGKILKITQNEEEAFWIFTQLVEQLLPIDYFCELAEMMTVCKLILTLLKNSAEEIFDHLNETGAELYLKNLVYKWLLSLFIQNTSEEYYYCIWDLLFLEGTVILFKSTFGLFRIISKDILKINSIEEAQDYFENKIDNYKDIDKLVYYLIVKRYDFDMDMIKENRNNLFPKIIEEIRNNGKFLLAKDETAVLDCDKDWPLCAKDTEYRHEISDYFVYKTLDKPNIITNFYEPNFNRKDACDEINKEARCKEEYYEKLLIERRKHVCDSQVTSITSLLKERRQNEEINADKYQQQRKNTFRKFQKQVSTNEDNKNAEEKIHKIVTDIEKDNENMISLPKERKGSDELELEKV